MSVESRRNNGMFVYCQECISREAKTKTEGRLSWLVQCRVAEKRSKKGRLVLKGEWLLKGSAHGICKYQQASESARRLAETDDWLDSTALASEKVGGAVK